MAESTRKLSEALGIPEVAIKRRIAARESIPLWWLPPAAAAAATAAAAKAGW